jgi:photosystem II stability/assembly factor-like uncharacterized protein
MRYFALIALSLYLSVSAAAADAPPGEWVNISDAITGPLVAAGKKIEYPGKGTTGAVFDVKTRTLFVVVPGQGLWGSIDSGKTFTRADDGSVGGRCETSYSLNADPAGGRLACFMLDGKCAFTNDAGKTWTPMTGLGRNWDYGSCDWSGDAITNIFAERHEVGGEAYLSTDAGKTWKLLFKDKEFDQTGGLGIFDATTLIRAKKGSGIERSTDAGETWTMVSDLQPVGRVAKVLKGTAYWLSKDGVLTSSDRGAIWTKTGDACPGTFGPYLDPNDPKRMVVAGPGGIFQTSDGGASWKLIAPFPPEYDAARPGWFTNIAWDPAKDIVFASRMGKPAYRWDAKK